MEKTKFIAMSRGRCPGLWSYYEFFSTLDEDNENNNGDWKQFSKKEDAVDYLYKHFVPGIRQFFVIFLLTKNCSIIHEWLCDRRVPSKQVYHERARI